MGEIAIHPTQLYSAFYGLLIFGLLQWLGQKPRFDGMLIGLFLILYGISRFLVDFYRYYESQMFLIDGLQFNQIVSLGLLISGIIILIYRWKNSEKDVPE